MLAKTCGWPYPSAARAKGQERYSNDSKMCLAPQFLILALDNYTSVRFLSVLHTPIKQSSYSLVSQNFNHKAHGRNNKED